MTHEEPIEVAQHYIKGYLFFKFASNFMMKFSMIESCLACFCVADCRYHIIWKVKDLSAGSY